MTDMTIINRFKKSLTTLHKRASRSNLVVKASVKIKNQLDSIIRARMNDGINMMENGEYWLMEQVAPKVRIFVDVGANTGAWSSALISLCDKDKFIRGLAIEPSPVAVIELTKTLAFHRGQGFALEILPVAVSDVFGIQPFYMEHNSGETSSLIARHSLPTSKKIDIEVSTIDSELKKRGIASIEFLKIDAEGYDFKVLRGARDILSVKGIGIIQFEYNKPWLDSGSSLRAAVDFLGDFGYGVFLLKREGLYALDYERYGDYFGYSNYVAISPDNAERFSAFVVGKI